ncbi:hypothetical protein Tco_0750328, partial [Tanacetum coccineum]
GPTSSPGIIAGDCIPNEDSPATCRWGNLSPATCRWVMTRHVAGERPDCCSGKYGPINLSTLIQSHTRKFACIINTPFVHWAADVAMHLGLPCGMELPSFVLPSNKLLQFDSILNEVFQNMHKIKWVLGNSFIELKKDVITSMNNDGRKFLPMGQIVPATLLGKEDN